MSNALEVTASDTRQLVASNLAAELRRKRWSDRQAATALGLSNVYVSRRTSGSVELGVTDLAMFANFLDVPITKFFEGMKKGPKSGVSGPSLPDLDSNQEPAGFPPAPIRLVPRRSSKPTPSHPGIVTPMHRSGTPTHRNAS